MLGCNIRSLFFFWFSANDLQIIFRSNFGHPVELLSNVIEILFQIRDEMPNRQEWTYSTTSLRSQNCRSYSIHLCCERRWIHYGQNSTEMGFLFQEVLTQRLSPFCPTYSVWWEPSDFRLQPFWSLSYYLRVFRSLTKWSLKRVLMNFSYRNLVVSNVETLNS